MTSLKHGDRVTIVAGRNEGKRGVFIKKIRLASCRVLLDGSKEDQMFRLSSIRRLPPPSSSSTSKHPPKGSNRSLSSHQTDVNREIFELIQKVKGIRAELTLVEAQLEKL